MIPWSHFNVTKLVNGWLNSSCSQEGKVGAHELVTKYPHLCPSFLLLDTFKWTSHVERQTLHCFPGLTQYWHGYGPGSMYHQDSFCWGHVGLYIDAQGVSLRTLGTDMSVRVNLETALAGLEVCALPAHHAGNSLASQNRSANTRLRQTADVNNSMVVQRLSRILQWQLVH